METSHSNGKQKHKKKLVMKKDLLDTLHKSSSSGSSCCKDDFPHTLADLQKGNVVEGASGVDATKAPGTFSLY